LNRQRLRRFLYRHLLCAEKRGVAHLGKLPGKGRNRLAKVVSAVCQEVRVIVTAATDTHWPLPGNRLLGIDSRTVLSFLVIPLHYQVFTFLHLVKQLLECGAILSCQIGIVDVHHPHSALQVVKLAAGQQQPQFVLLRQSSNPLCLGKVAFEQFQRFGRINECNEAQFALPGKIADRPAVHARVMLEGSVINTENLAVGLKCMVQFVKEPRHVGPRRPVGRLDIFFNQLLRGIVLNVVKHPGIHIHGRTFQGPHDCRRRVQADTLDLVSIVHLYNLLGIDRCARREVPAQLVSSPRMKVRGGPVLQQPFGPPLVQQPEFLAPVGRSEQLPARFTFTCLETVCLERKVFGVARIE